MAMGIGGASLTWCCSETIAWVSWAIACCSSVATTSNLQLLWASEMSPSLDGAEIGHRVEYSCQVRRGLLRFSNGQQAKHRQSNRSDCDESDDNKPGPSTSFQPCMAVFSPIQLLLE